MRLNSQGFGTPAATWCGDFASSGWSLLVAEDMEVTGKQKVWPNNIVAVVSFYFWTGPINDFLSWTGWSPIAKVNRATKINCKDSQHEVGEDSGGFGNDDFCW